MGCHAAPRSPPVRRRQANDSEAVGGKAYSQGLLSIVGQGQQSTVFNTGMRFGLTPTFRSAKVRRVAAATACPCGPAAATQRELQHLTATLLCVCGGLTGAVRQPDGERRGGQTKRRISQGEQEGAGGRAPRVAAAEARCPGAAPPCVQAAAP